jgi:hypothetical protein
MTVSSPHDLDTERWLLHQRACPPAQLGYNPIKTYLTVGYAIIEPGESIAMSSTFAIPWRNGVRPCR